jgi:dihydrofolate synthase/folylpolyglutamate synthase
MNFEESVRYLLSLGRELAAPTQAAAAKFNLENILTLAESLGHPERRYPAVHVAGTNGKGSTAAFLDSILRRAGLRTGLYTSPHLERINERIRVDGGEIPDRDFARVFSAIHRVIERLLAEGRLRAHPTFFECVTAAALVHFADESVNVAVFETGLGGRLDATNLLTPAVSVITRVDFDHENFLGHSLREIAAEKGGIIKPGVPVVLADQREEVREVLLARARELAAPVTEVGKIFLVESEQSEGGRVVATVREPAGGRALRIAPSLPGRFQLGNALGAAAAARVLASRGIPVGDSAVEEGIGSTVWPGRIEKVHARPDIYLDGAHNPSAARELARFLGEHFAGRKVFLIFGALRDKAVDEIAGILFPHAAEVLLTEPDTSRAISATQLAEIAGHHAARLAIVPRAAEALDRALARASADDAIFITGSLYLVGQLRSRVRNSELVR